MSDVIKINRRPTNIVAFSESASVFHTSAEQEKENHQIALHNQYTKGFSDGQKAIKEKIEAEYNQKLLLKYSDLTNLISELNEKAQHLDSQFEEVVIAVSFLLAEAIIKKEISKESIIKQVLEEALRKVIGANEILVRLNPADYQSIIEDEKSFQLKDSFSHIKFEKDERIEQGGCFIESEIGNADGRISSQLNELKRKFEAAINSD
ncbi:MAG: FliH/SctL family protein [Ignavibacterium sp.]|jgi:flagellar biosynthesis/type III secretory pathway protein FliH|nr:FliH/SctL family protein [Ignavibacterium sp.]